MSGFCDSYSPLFTKVVIWYPFLNTSKHSLLCRKWFSYGEADAIRRWGASLPTQPKLVPRLTFPHSAPQMKHETYTGASIWTFFSYELLKSLFRILALEISFPRKIIKLSFYFRLFNLQESTHDNEYINLLSFSLSLSDAVLVLLHLGSHQSLSNSKINPLEVVIPINSLYGKFSVKACWRWSVGLLLICWSYRETYFGSI